MENETGSITDGEHLQMSLLLRTLSSWRFLLLSTFPPMTWVVFVASPGTIRVAVALLCAIVWFGCWRLWLDGRYFALLSLENNTQTGDALNFIWQRERLTRLSLVERQQGAIKRLRRTLIMAAITWGIWLVAIGFVA
ncbi:hypothetical protein ACPUEX_22145 [Enterobacter vonholyi]|uniref:hypothetical protein n=1 Tax=Enterobacter asburiae TaxID=61645 RepID=UPI001EF7FB0C|nr:hypothetical protein [Enterobacter asburiae]MCG7803881.1 hypothetical protein [Enterobacter asburiae]UKU09980.1 hypothetical protein [Enterobacter asburiae]